MNEELPRYRLTSATFLKPVRVASGSLRRAGEVVTFDGVPSLGMSPLNGAAKAAYAQMLRYEVRRPARPGSHLRVFEIARAIGVPAGPIDETRKAIREWMESHTEQPAG
ncbi:MAG: hypothetical protein K5821_13440 [Nitrobacter sp.]|uniref:hypothetical protein n=1 Tax=Nitrobacter sp. TaxID=29420 RepID=UPI00262BCEE3|nr:hypothetical protein [Nitrobacter sp.]MCV0387407.1 hypothetical protein [Nitrobacter sp.]